MDNEASGTLEIRQYLALLWRWLWLIVLAAVVAGAAAYVTSRMATPIYDATATLHIVQGQKVGGPDYSSILMSEQLAQTYARMLSGQPIVDEAAARLGVEADDLDVTSSPIRDTQLIQLSVQGPDPRVAADMANTIPTVFVEWNQKAQAARYADSIGSLSREMQQVEGDMEDAQASLEAARAAQTPDPAEVARLETLLAQYRSTYDGLLQSYEQIRVAQAQGVDLLTVFEPAEVPEFPSQPRTRTNTMLAAVVGAMLAVGVAFLVEYLDDTLKLPEDVARAGGLATFATIARLPGQPPAGEPPLMASLPDSAIAEAYRVLRTNLEFATLGMHHSSVSLLVTSALPVEGKSTTLANLGIALAQEGKRVLLVDTDLRRPTLHKQFDLPNTGGLTSLYLQPDADPRQAIQPTLIDGLSVLTSGPLPSNPAEMLGFPHTAAILERLAPLADYVILDSPPVLSVADASILAQRVDGIVMVAEAGKTRSDVFRRAVAALQAVNARLLGVVLNKLTARPGSYYYHYYYYNHYGPDGARRAKRRHRESPAEELRRRTWQSVGVPPTATPAAMRPVAPSATAEAAAPGATARRAPLWPRTLLTVLAGMVLVGLLLQAALLAYDRGQAPPSAATLTPRAPTAVHPTPQAAAPLVLSVVDAGAPTPTLSPTPAPALATATSPAVVTPTAEPSAAARPIPTVTPGAHGLAANLRLAAERTVYAPGEEVAFVLTADNTAAQAIAVGLVGLKTEPGGAFKASASGTAIAAGAVLTVEDRLTFPAPGAYTVIPAICFSSAEACPQTGADWEEFAPGVVVEVR